MKDEYRLYAEEIRDPWSIKANTHLEQQKADYRLDSFEHRKHRKIDAFYVNKKNRIAEAIWWDYPEMLQYHGAGKVASLISNMPNDLWSRRCRKPDKHHARFLAKRDISDQIEDAISEKEEAAYIMEKYDMAV